MNNLPGAGADTIFHLGGGQVWAGPSPESLAAVEQHLGGIAHELDTLRMRLGHIALVDWHSPAAVAFRQALSGLNAEMAAAVQSVGKAAAEVESYGSQIKARQEQEYCAAPEQAPLHWAPGIWVW